MTQVTIKVYRSNGAAGDRARTLVETRRVETGSDEPLTAKRAGQVIAREYPACARIGGVGVIRTREGWQVSRALQPTDRCGYHFIWEEVVVYEE